MSTRAHNGTSRVGGGDLYKEAEKHLARAVRLSREPPGLEHAMPRSIRRVGVIGAGTMGGGIAMSFADAGIPVTLVDVSRETCERGLAAVRGNYERSIRSGRLTDAEVKSRLELIATSHEFEALAEANLIIEAVYENLELKQKIFRQLDAICRHGTILATNTSTLDVNAIAAVTGRPQDVIGTHFFSPANVMKLIEIVRGDRTSPEAIASVLSAAQSIRKIPVVVGVCFGFVGNRMLEPYAREAHRLLLEGAGARQIERALMAFGFKMDPLSMYDLAGIDVGFLVRESRRDAIAHDPSYQIMGDKLYALGRFGLKTGRGFYRYADRQKLDDPEVEAIAATTADELKIVRRDIADEEILERCLYVLINEGAEVLREGIAARASDCDVIWCHGYGFPPARGGPLFHADRIGVVTVLEGIRRYRTDLGAYGEMWFKPSPFLERLATERSSFEAWDESHA